MSRYGLAFEARRWCRSAQLRDAGRRFAGFAIQ
jgi:hypothetical protein